MGEFKYSIEKEIGVIAEGSWNKEINFVSFNGAAPKYDIRTWSPDHAKMGKGITLTLDELKELKNILDSLEELA